MFPLMAFMINSAVDFLKIYVFSQYYAVLIVLRNSSMSELTV